jgi:hypothetical protein
MTPSGPAADPSSTMRTGGRRTSGGSRAALTMPPAPPPPPGRTNAAAPLRPSRAASEALGPTSGRACAGVVVPRDGFGLIRPCDQRGVPAKPQFPTSRTLPPHECTATETSVRGQFLAATSPHTHPPLSTRAPHKPTPTSWQSPEITETNRIHLVLFGMQNRTLRPYLAITSAPAPSADGGFTVSGATFFTVLASSPSSATVVDAEGRPDEPKGAALREPLGAAEPSAVRSARAAMRDDSMPPSCSGTLGTQRHLDGQTPWRTVVRTDELDGGAPDIALHLCS